MSPCLPVQPRELEGSNVQCETLVVRSCLTVNGADIIPGVIGALFLGGVNLPAIAAGPLNNYVPPVDVSQATFLSFQLTGAPGVVSLTGLDLGPPGQLMGRIVVLFNRLNSTKSLQVEHQNAGSNPTNRFVNGSTGGARLLGPGGAAIYAYDVGGSQRYTLLAAASL
jgi:hypothetical protein